MKKERVLIIERYDGIYKKAVNLLSGALSGYFGATLPVRFAEEVGEEIFEKTDAVIVGSFDSPLISSFADMGVITKRSESESYSIYVGKHPRCESEIIVIAGADAAGTLYGCVDFINRYCGSELWIDGYLWKKGRFDRPFDSPLRPWRADSAPSVATRAIWTWGHVIYDYRRFFDNMALLRLNEVVIWNDCVPFNARDVVDYAHSLGIKVIWGFAWGWSTKCEDFASKFNRAALEDIKASVLQTYENDYADTGADGIYFQSFTEMSREEVGGKSIAELVTDLVNETAGELLSRYPELHIQFGLHATSVKNRLDVIKQVDPRIYIIWEDCGAFPYAYRTHETAGAEEMLAFTERLIGLRGEGERFGAVLKGMLNLDWMEFEHFKGRYILGERTNEYIKERSAQKDKIWKTVQGGWIRNAELVKRTVEIIAKNKNSVVEGLVEDAMLEDKIAFPVALYAELLWNSEASVDQLIAEISAFPSVKFANL